MIATTVKAQKQKEAARQLRACVRMRVGRGRRSASGQGIIEGTVGLVMITMGGVLLIAMLVNCYAQIVNSGKAQVVAQLAANALEKDRYWLGVMERDDYNAETATTKARNLAEAVATQMGLPPLQDFNVTESQGGGGVIQKVQVSFGGLRLPFVAGGVFPSTFAVQGIGCTAQVATKAYALMNIGCQKPGDPTRQEVATIPVMRFSIGVGSQPTFNGQVNPSAYASSETIAGGNGSGTFGNGGPLPGGFPTYYRGLPIVLPNTPAANQPAFSPYVVENLSGSPTGRFLP